MTSKLGKLRAKRENRFILAVAAVIICILIIWFAFSRTRQQPPLDRNAAIAYLQQQYPDLKDYPSNSLPPKSIMTQQDGSDLYIAFVQNGSGRPIISAKCYLIKPDYSVTASEFTAAPSDTSTDFSAKTCSAVPAPTLAGGDHDQHGCIGSAGYSWDATVGACLRSWELNSDQKKAAQTAVAPLSFPVTVIEVTSQQCQGCFSVKLQRNDNQQQITTKLNNWKITN